MRRNEALRAPDVVFVSVRCKHFPFFVCVAVFGLFFVVRWQTSSPSFFFFVAFWLGHLIFVKEARSSQHEKGEGNLSRSK